MTEIHDIPTQEPQEEFYELHGAYAQALHNLNQFLSRLENQGKAFRIYSDEMIAGAFDSNLKELRSCGDEDLWGEGGV